MACLSTYKRAYLALTSGFTIKRCSEELHRVDDLFPPSNPSYNTPDWRLWRRIVRAEAHKRGLANYSRLGT